MDKALVGTGLVTKHMELVVNATTEEHTTRRNAKLTAASPLRNGKWPFNVDKWMQLLIIAHETDVLVIIRYHVPRSWLNPTGNLLVVFEEWGGDAAGIAMVKRSVSSVCADVSEWQPSMSNWHTRDHGQPKVRLFCGTGQNITAIKFASFGTPQGVCGGFSEGSCHAHKSYDAFEKVNWLRHLLDCLPHDPWKLIHWYIHRRTVLGRNVARWPCHQRFSEEIPVLGRWRGLRLKWSVDSRWNKENIHLWIHV